MQCCPTADDIWLTVIALRGGFKIAQLDSSENFTEIPKTQMKRLFDFNVLLGANQIQLIRTFSEVDLSALWNLQASERQIDSENIVIKEKHANQKATRLILASSASARITGRGT